MDRQVIVDRQEAAGVDAATGSTVARPPHARHCPGAPARALFSARTAFWLRHDHYYRLRPAAVFSSARARVAPFVNRLGAPDGPDEVTNRDMATTADTISHLRKSAQSADTAVAVVVSPRHALARARVAPFVNRLGAPDGPDEVTNRDMATTADTISHLRKSAQSADTAVAVVVSPRHALARARVAPFVNRLGAPDGPDEVTNRDMATTADTISHLRKSAQSADTAVAVVVSPASPRPRVCCCCSPWRSWRPWRLCRGRCTLLPGHRVTPSVVAPVLSPVVKAGPRWTRVWSCPQPRRPSRCVHRRHRRCRR